MLDLNSTSPKPEILIIDDDATIRLLMREMLTDEIYTINEAENGAAGLEQIKARQPDLVLLDVNMPGINGFEVCTEIRRLYGEADISIVMVTALEDSRSIEKAYHLGATDFISKPINWDTFTYRIQYLVKARNAIVEIKNNKLHLEYMEHVSRIIAQNKNKDVIMQETMFAMLDIFSADRAILIRPDETTENGFVIDCETANNSIESINSLAPPLTEILDYDTLFKASNSEYPVLTRYDSSNPAPASCQTLKQQLLSALHLKQAQNWYLIIQQNTVQANWNVTDEETFYKISLHLTNMLSRYLLTEELSRSEKLLKQAQKIGHLGNWHWNAMNNWLTWSDEVYQIYECQRGCCTPDINKYFDIEFKEDNDRLALFNEIKNKKRYSYQIDHRIRTPDNNIKWLREQCIGIYKSSGELIEVNGFVQDITDARNKKEQEVHNNKMDAIGQLTSGLAHDFGNLMTVAKGNLELLKDSLARQNNIDSGNAELLEDAYSAVYDSVELTKQLLTFSRKKSISPVYINVQQTINKFKKLFKNTIGDRVSMSINIDDNLPDILVDPVQFESSLLNIIINARNAMPNGGTIEINAEIMVAGQFHRTIHREDNENAYECICIYIKDNGIGMSDSVLEHAVEPFYTTQINQGTGLGLSMVYGFLKQSGGELIIKSQPEKGTTVYMQFPIRDGKALEESKETTGVY